MSIATILATLGSLEKLHRSLLRLAYDKTNFIKSGDLELLDQLLKDEQAHLAAIVQLDSQRRRDVAQYLADQGRSVPMNPTIADLLDAAPETDKKNLEEERDRLLHAIHDLKGQNELNQKLTYQSLQFVNLSLDMVRPRLEALNYSKPEINGRLESKEQRTFDSQA
ncbi:flagellar protein FlgN [Sporosarcina sp. E16_3]|uniref:flagellar protein FlgN n=1 Tax=Sporosarcina sp. E16_3 TaxID=2789293 RepID=UPI001A914763|nr:flagellar protein FlgN [Sporosarcina sp. E16_3]MBO0603723.1 flagellar protein FlgN [Sporosarcina sp. E16_3]